MNNSLFCQDLKTDIAYSASQKNTRLMEYESNRLKRKNQDKG